MACPSRPSYDEMYLQTAELWRARSTCCKYKTGCVIVKDKDIIALGYNGSLPQAVHCDQHWYTTWLNEYKATCTFNEFVTMSYFRSSHRTWSRRYEQHGEKNALMMAARRGHATKGCTLYTYMSPCFDCAADIVSAGIVRVVYRKKHKPEGIEILRENSIIVDHVPRTAHNSL